MPTGHCKHCCVDVVEQPSTDSASPKALTLADADFAAESDSSAESQVALAPRKPGGEPGPSARRRRHGVDFADAVVEACQDAPRDDCSALDVPASSSDSAPAAMEQTPNTILRAKVWHRAEEEQVKLFEYQWSIVSDQMSQIAALADGVTVLRQELKVMRKQNSDSFQSLAGDSLQVQHRLQARVALLEQTALHNSLQSETDGLIQAVAAADQRIASLEKAAFSSTVQADREARIQALADAERRLAYVEHALGVFVEEHAKTACTVQDQLEESESRMKTEVKTVLHEHNRKTTASSESLAASVTQRVDYLEKLLGESADRHTDHKATMEERLEFVEKSLGDSAEHHAKHDEVTDALHKAMQDMDSKHRSLQSLHHGEKDAREVAHATVAERLEYLEKLMGDSADKHKEMEDAHRMMMEGHDGTKGHLDAAHQKVEDLYTKLAAHASMQQRLEFLENALGESADKHKEMEYAHRMMMEGHDGTKGHLDAAHQKVEDLYTKLAAQASMQQRLEFLENALVESADKHKEMEECKGSIMSEVRALVEKEYDGAKASSCLGLAVVEQRFAHVETTIANRVNNHSEKISRIQEKLQDSECRIQNEVDSLVQHHCRTAISSFQKSFQTQLEHTILKVSDAELRVVSHDAEQRKALIDAENRWQEVERLLEEHKLLAEPLQQVQPDEFYEALEQFRDHVDNEQQFWEQQHTWLQQRLQQMDKRLEEHTDRYSNHQGIDTYVKTTCEILQNRYLKTEQRIEALESKICTSGAKYAKELEVACAVAHEQLDLNARISELTKDLRKSDDGTASSPDQSISTFCSSGAVSKSATAPRSQLSSPGPPMPHSWASVARLREAVMKDA